MLWERQVKLQDVSSRLGQFPYGTYQKQDHTMPRSEFLLATANVSISEWVSMKNYIPCAQFDNLVPRKQHFCLET